MAQSRTPIEGVIDSLYDGDRQQQPLWQRACLLRQPLTLSPTWSLDGRTSRSLPCSSLDRVSSAHPMAWCSLAHVGFLPVTLGPRTSLSGDNGARDGALVQLVYGADKDDLSPRIALREYDVWTAATLATHDLEIVFSDCPRQPTAFL
ncbi:hypothetical protein MTO96_006913 [Rhipicephalus appendiculatus]